MSVHTIAGTLVAEMHSHSGDKSLPLQVRDDCLRAAHLIDEMARENAAAKPFYEEGDEVCGMLANYSGETGQSEGPVETLERILANARLGAALREHWPTVQELLRLEADATVETGKYDRALAALATLVEQEAK